MQPVKLREENAKLEFLCKENAAYGRNKKLKMFLKLQKLLLKFLFFKFQKFNF